MGGENTKRLPPRGSCQRMLTEGECVIFRFIHNRILRRLLPSLPAANPPPSRREAFNNSSHNSKKHPFGCLSRGSTPGFTGCRCINQSLVFRTTNIIKIPRCRLTSGNRHIRANLMGDNFFSFLLTFFFSAKKKVS